MNRRALIVLPVALALAAALLPARTTHAQGTPTADVVASWVQSFYDQTTTVQARFTQHFWNRVYSRTTSSGGRLAIERPGRIRFDYAQPAGQVLVSDGASWTFYQPGEEGSAGQYATGGAAMASSSALGFLMGTAQMTSFHRSLRPRSATQPENTIALELRPRTADPHYTRIVVYVDERPASRGVVRRVSVEDPDGNWNRFDFSEFQFDRPLPAGTFRYTPPAGARELSGPRASTP